MKLRLISRRFVLALMLIAGHQAAQADTARGIVTVTFDDANAGQYEDGLRLAKEYGIAGTLFVPTLTVRDEMTGVSTPSQMDWDQVRAFVDAGWEIGAHGRRHIRLPELDSLKMEEEILGPIVDIESKLGVKPVSFSSPFGDFTDGTIERIMEHYDYHLSWKGHGGRNPIDDIDPRYIGRLEVINTMTSAEVCGEMVNAALHDKWLVLLFHGLVHDEPGEYEVHVRLYEDILACASLLDRKGVVDVMTVQDAMAEISRRN